ncbi:hypothetical protein I4U23_000266 [Adineta vaga]|nr:hypothetical protein I4U23_000266 [Adineta vaga]
MKSPEGAGTGRFRAGFPAGSVLVNEAEAEILVLQQQLQTKNNKLLEYEKKIDLYRNELLLVKEKLATKEKGNIDLQKQIDKFIEEIRFQEAKLLMLQQQVLNDDDKFDALINRIASLQNDNTTLKTRLVGILYFFDGIMVCLM